jgi:pimeloyl-ACP methyl ester carboxylesterase
MIGPRYALRYPARVKSLGLWSTAAFRSEDGSGGRDRTYDQLINSQLLYR